MQSKLNTIVDNTTIALKSQLNALFADLLVESEEYNETNQILLTLPIVKKLISASAYVAAHTQPEADQAPQLNTMNISQTCTFNYDSLNHITPPIIDEDENEDTPQQEHKEEKESVNEDENKGLDEDEEQVEDEEESIEDSEVQVQEVETTVRVAPSVIDPTAVTNEEAKENICLEIIEPDEPEEEDYDEGDEQDEDVEDDDKEDEAVVETKIEEVVEEVDESDEEDVEEADEEEEEDDEEPEEPKVELEEPKVEPPKTEEPLDEEEEESEEEEQSSEEELVTEEETKEESDEEEGEEEDDGEEVFEIDIFGKTYYTNNATNGDIYLVDESGDPGDEVGKFVNGIATFSKK